MAQKSRLREDAFAWVRDTSQPEEKPKSPARPKAVVAEKTKPPARPNVVVAAKPRSAALPAGPRSILVRYEKNSGRIVGILEKKSGSDIDISWSAVVATHDVHAFALADDLASMELFDIHEKYEVDVPSLTLRLI